VARLISRGFCPIDKRTIFCDITHPEIMLRFPVFDSGANRVERRPA
jgi:hypothetical protein